MGLDPELDAKLQLHSAAFFAAARRVHEDRRRMSLADAEDIVRTEFDRRGVTVSDEYIQTVALDFHRGFFWRFLHPIQARREGYSFAISLRRD